LHECRQADAQTDHLCSVGVTKTMQGHLAGTTSAQGGLGQGTTEHVVDGMTSSAAAREQKVVRLRQPSSWRKSAQLHNIERELDYLTPK
jgi:hypothetical protein